MRNVNSFPILKLSMHRKTKQWKEDCVDYIIGAGNSYHMGDDRSDEAEMQTYYNLYNSIYDEKDLKYVTNPFKQDDGFPATAQDYNIIKPKVDLLLGEETKRPFNFHVCRTGDIASSELLDELKAMLEQYIMAAIQSKMGPEEQAQFQQAIQNGEIQTPDQIAKYATKDYKDIAEIEAQHALEYLKRRTNFTHEFFKGWKDALIAGREIYYTGIINGEPVVERINPMVFKWEKSPDIEFIHDASWCCRKMQMSASEVYDRFYDKLSEKQLNELLDLVDQRPGANPMLKKTSVDDFNHIKFQHFDPSGGNFDTDHVTVWHVCWKSYKKIGFVSILNPETGEVEDFQVDEDYKESGLEESIEWKWIIEVWEGYRANQELYFGIQPLEYAHVSADNPNSQRLPYTGVIYNNTNTKSKSLVSMMKPLQYMYIVVWYRLELAMSRDKGKVPVIDVTQIPKNMGIDVNKWMHYLGALGVAFINPYEEGWDIPGREGGKPAQFNQFQAWDLSMSNVIDQYVNLMAKIEDMASEITGVSKQREGAISSNELVGNVERSVIQSAHITEPWFWMHNQVKREVLTMMLNTSKECWKDNKTYLNYILDDATRAFVQLSDKFFYEDFDIFVDDATKNQQQIEQLKSLMQPAMQNGASLLDIAEIITMDNVTMIKDRLQEIEQKRMEQMQQQQQAEQQAQMEMQQMQNELKEEELMIKEAEMDLKKYEIDQNNATKITVAQLSAYRGTENMDADGNGVPDVIELGNLALAERKEASEEADRKLELNNKRRETEMKKEIENKKIELEKLRMEHEMKLQQQKDKAALEREKLKARTALKNKTVSGK